VSRPLVALALLAYAVLGILPLAVMLARMDGGDLAGLFDARTASLLWRTLLLGGASALLALALGLPFGFIVARTDVPGAGALRALGVLPLLIPPLFLAMTWCVLLPHLRGAPAAIGVLALSTFPLVGVFAGRAFERIDARQEEAALLAGGLRAALRMELPLVLPAACAGACLAFAFAVNDFGVPDYVSSVGVKFNVYADEIHFNWNQSHEPGKPVATALPLIALTLCALLPALALRRRGAMASLAGGFRSPAPLALGAWRWPACAAALGLILLGAGIPLGRLLYEAGNMPRHAEELGLWTGEAWAAGWASAREAFGLAIERAQGDLRRSLIYSSAAALLAVPLGLVLGHAVERARPRAGRALELVSLLPLAAPAILFGIGIIVLWNRDVTALVYDSSAMAIILLVGRFAVFPVLISAGAVAALDPRLEEAGALGGAGPLRRLAAIVAPSLRGALAGGFVLVFVLAMRDLDSAILVPAMNQTAIFRAFNGVHFGRDSYVAALSLLLVFAVVLPGLLYTLFARRRLEVLP
jgi:iron(III) transport system permease protein